MRIYYSTAIILFGFLSACLNACGQNKHLRTDNAPKLWQYIDNPAAKDTECRTEVARAERDLHAGRLIFCSPSGFGSSPLRYEQQLRTLAKKYGLSFNYEIFSDVMFEGQTQGCYSAVMDKAIAAKFGNDFKKKIESRADSLFTVAAETSTVDYTNCDTHPSLPNESDRDPEIYLKVSPKLIAKPRPKIDDYGPFMDIGFIIEKTGKGHDFEMVSYLDSSKDGDTIKPFEAELWSIAQSELQSISTWVPGMIKGKAVKTRAVVRVHFQADE